MEDARTMLADNEINENYDSSYKFEEGVIEISDGTEVYFDTEDQITVVDCPVGICEGDTFIVYVNGLPIAYNATAVTIEDNITIISVERADASVFQSVDEQGIIELTDEDCSFIPATEEEQLVGSGGEVSYGNLHFQNGNLWVEMSDVEGATAELYLSDMSVSHSFSDDGYSILLNGSLGYKGQLKISNSLNLPLGELRIFGVGAIKLSVTLTESMSVSADVNGTFSTGMTVSADGTRRVIKDFTTSDPNITGKGSITLAIKVTAGLDILVVSADVYAEIGMTTQYTSKVTYDIDLEKSVHCQDFKYYLFTEVGAEAKYYAFWNGEMETLSSKQLELPDEIARPYIFQVHYEDGERVDHCSYGMEVEDWDLGGISASFESTIGTDDRSRIMETSVILPGDLVISGDYTISDGILDLNGHVLTIEGNLTQTGGVVQIGGGRLIVKGDYLIQGPEWKPSEGVLDICEPDAQVDIEGDFIVQSNQVSSIRFGIIRLKGNFYQYNTNKVTSNFIADSSLTFSMCGGEGQSIHFDTPLENSIGNLQIEHDISVDSDLHVNGASLNGNTLTVNGILRQSDGTFTTGGGNVAVSGIFS